MSKQMTEEGRQVARELADTDRKLEELRKKKATLIRRFTRVNAGMEQNAFFRSMVFHCGLAPAIGLYMRVFDEGILEAKKNVYNIMKKL